MFDAIALQRAKVVPVTELHEEGLENCPVPIATGGAVVALEINLDVSLDVVVVEKRVVDIDQEDGLMHWSYPYATLCTTLSQRLSRAKISQDCVAPTGVSKSPRAEAV